MEEKMNLFMKLAKARNELSEMKLKMSGKNTFANYEYYELSDILPAVAKVEEKYKMLSVINFGKELATLTLYDAESDQKMEFTCEVKDSEIKGASPIQQYGGMQTYTRRYLFLNLYNFSEVDGGEITFNPNEKKDKKPVPKEMPKSNENGVIKSELEQALKRLTSGGKEYKDLREDQLDYIVDHSSDALSKEYAKWVKEYKHNPNVVKTKYFVWLKNKSKLIETDEMGNELVNDIVIDENMVEVDGECPF